MLSFFWGQFKVLSVTLFFDVGLPLIIYYTTKDKIGYVTSLVVSGIPPLLFVIYKFWRDRKVDIIGCIFIVAFVGSGVLTLITGDVRIALFREAAVDILIGAIFFVTLIPIKTKWLTMQPLVYLITVQMTSEAPPMEWSTRDETTGEVEHHSQPMHIWLWEQLPFYRRFCYILTALWAFIMAADFVIKAVIILATNLSVDQIVMVNSILQIVITAGMTSGTMVAAGFLHRKIHLASKEFKEKYPLLKDPEEAVGESAEELAPPS
ncbi:hypothetical protein DM01DRAFT_1289888 [Hesseltinella vesiculosa]|uniref:Uncharacterized protein n=1 Tax=Hesseltinella vesiculosa TaxID=101127 RepID=A0A1X2GDE6_9FUNG|nr:hypothetical protein DM01DRAFT_1289888 [Hesseltinella vesiculosa]